MNNDVSYIDILHHEDCIRVEEALSKNAFETTQLVYLIDPNGIEHGPYIRKFINKELGLGNAYIQLYDAQLSGFDSEGLPCIFAITEDDKKLVVLIEYIKGQTLLEAVKSCTNYNERLDVVSRYFPQICDAVAVLHTSFEMPIIHRDLKPSNIMIAADSIKLLDLGIARMYKQEAESDTRHFGTRPYAPPEQYGFGQTDVRSDIYALGKVLYFCLTDEEPAIDTVQGLSQHEELDSSLHSVIIHATKLDPDARPHSMQDFKMELENSLKDASKNTYDLNAAACTAPENHNAQSEDNTTNTSSTELIIPNSSKQPLTVLGIIWDIFLLLIASFTVAGGISAFINPTPENLKFPTWYLFYALFFWAVPIFLIILYSISDRRPIRKLIPALATHSIEDELAKCIIAIIILFVAWIIVTLAVGFL